MEKITVNPQVVSGLRTLVNQSVKKIKNSQREFKSIPLTGVFAEIGFMVYTKEGEGINSEIPGFLVLPFVNEEGETVLKDVNDEVHIVNNALYLYSLGLTTKCNNFVSENMLTAQQQLPVLTEVKNGDNAGRFTLKSQRMSDLDKFGFSGDARLAKLIGKSYSATPNDLTRVWKSNALSNYRDNCTAEKTENMDKDLTLEKLLEQTEIKKLYTFKVQ